jgi:phospholipid/cholesterol/gamma-HCH transport system substrate-binding protein
MNKYRGAQLIRAGLIGAVLIILVIAVGLQPARLVSWATSAHYQAEFADAGGLAVGNDVTRSGIKVGAVSAISLRNGKALVTFSVDQRYRLGSQTSAHIRTGTLLGARVLALQSAGTGFMPAGDVIPVTRTSSP